MKKVDIGTKFNIGVKAKKHDDKVIWREGMWTEGCGMWTTKSGKLVLTYYDIVKNCFRMEKSGLVMKQTNSKEIN